MRLLFNVNVAWFFISHRLELARAAKERGFEVHISGDIDSSDEVAALEREGFEFHRMHLSRGGLKPVHDFLYLRELGRLARSVRPDLIHNVTVKPVIYGTLAGRGARVPRIVSAVSGLGYAFAVEGSRRWLSRLVKSAYRTALHHPNVKVIFQNEDDVDLFVRAQIIEPDQAVLIKGSGVDLDVFSLSPEPSGNPVVVLPSRMLRDKGVVEFARAAQVLLRAGSTAEFVLAGKTDIANPASLRDEEMKSLVEETGVKWLGHVSDMPALYRRSHIVCLPSYREGLPKSLLEACATGRAIVATNVPGCREAVRTGVNGLLVEPRDSNALAAAISVLLENPSLRRDFGAAGRRIAEAHFDVRSVVGATLALYESMLR